MLSALQSRETGFGVHISRIQMEEINDTCRGRNYSGLDAAIAIHGQVVKKDLEQSPFVLSFELGMNNEGYWTYNHTSIQSSRYFSRRLTSHFYSIIRRDMQRSLWVVWMHIMNRDYGGAQPMMRESKIKEHDCYLGSNAQTLDVGDTQSFVFTLDNNGPAFWTHHIKGRSIEMTVYYRLHQEILE
jgi:hypothetical protein